MKRGIATMTLDYGHVPPWLFDRMVRLSRSIAIVLVDEFGPDEFIQRLADPVWFQALSCVIGMDWNSSGTTVITTGALKVGLRGLEKDLGVFICGGKGKTSRKTPDEILGWGEKLNLPPGHANNLVYNSKMSAKVDSALIQDGFQIYHHSFFFSNPPAGGGAWAVVQQGMNTVNQTARRYHWYSENINDLVCEPHSGIATQVRESQVLNLSAKESEKTRSLSTELVSSSFQTLMSDIELLKKHSSTLSKMMKVSVNGEGLTLLKLSHNEFHHHPVEEESFWDSPYLKKILEKLSDQKPENYEKLLATKGVGPKTVRALSLVSEIIYGAKPSYEDPARYSFAHGGKDATPYPVDRPTYDQTIETLKQAVIKSKINAFEKDKALRRLCRNPS